MSDRPFMENTDEELLDMLDNTLRNGSNPTRANLVFDELCERLGFDRHELPGYVADAKKLEEEDAEHRAEYKELVSDWVSLQGGLCSCEHYRVTHTNQTDRCNALGCSCTSFYTRH